MRPEKAQDTQYQETTITKAQGGPEAGWSVTMADGWSLFIDKDSPIIPKEGMKIRTYGKGIGYKIRGIDLDGQEVFYRTPNE
ncbi:MAG: hypothetical protein GWN86_27755, partial [Desulfobacterales bacterium]|nr:hypothetical protein [Desulfobacterales bacterium]